MSEIQNKLNSLSNSKLIDVVKQYKQFGYPEEYKTEALKLLEQRGVSIEDLKLTGAFQNHQYERAQEYYNLFSKYSLITFLLNISVFVSLFVLPYFIDNTINFTFAWIAIIIVYIAFLIQTFIVQSKFYKHIRKKSEDGAFLLAVVGVLFYFILHFYFRKRMKNQMNS